MEFTTLFGGSAIGDGADERILAAAAKSGVNLLLTLGGHGAAIAERGQPLQRVSAPKVTVVDTTGAGLPSLRVLGTETSGKTIQVTPPLPAQIVVVPDLCSVSCEDPGTTLTIDVGDEDDRDRYADGIVLSSGGTVRFGSGTAAVTPHRPSTGQAIIAYIDTAATLSAGKKLTFVVVYRGKA
jgi:hypothetical protein